ncbi:MAG: YIP1 family protein [Candidatus Azobacteroides sp.]|nr:YIP1 family protein [Candidatus Azobacteroides sp.]
MLKDLFERLYRIIFQPATTWNILADEKGEEIIDNDSFLKTYLYPVIGVVALATFIGGIFYKKEFDVQLALKLTIKVSIALFAGFYLASYLLSEIMPRYFSREKNYKECQRFAGYSSALVYVMYIILAILPDFGFLQLILLYTIYMIWEGAITYMQISENERSKFTIMATAIVLLSPIIIEKMMYFTMPGMRI